MSFYSRASRRISECHGPAALKAAGFLMVLGLIFNSCLVHEYNITVLEDGRVNYVYTATGDSADLYDGLTALPDSVIWKVERGIDIDTSQGGSDTSYYYRASGWFSPGRRNPIPESFGVDYVDYAQLSLRHPMNVRRQDLFFMVNYIFEFEFKSRRRTELYGDPLKCVPKEITASVEENAVDDSSDEYAERIIREKCIEWLGEMFRTRFSRSLRKSMEMHTELTVPPEKITAVETALGVFIKQFLDNLRVEDDEDICALWRTAQDSGYGIIEEQLNFLGDTTFFLDMKTVGEMLARENEITEDLGDEGFKVEVFLPGKLRTSNADSAVVERTDSGEMKNHLFWEFKGEDLADSTIVLAAVSTVHRPLRIYICGGIFILVLLWFIRKIFRKPSHQAG